MAVIKRPTSSSAVLIGGAFTTVFSLIMGLLVLFAVPTACSFLGSLQLIILGFLFVVGVLTFLVGLILSRRK